MIDGTPDARLAPKAEREQREQQNGRVTGHPRPRPFARAPVSHGDGHGALEGAFWRAVPQDGSDSPLHPGIVRLEPEIGQGGKGVDGVTGIVVALERSFPPSCRSAEEPLDQRVGDHLPARGAHLRIGPGPLDQVHKRPILRPRLVATQQPSDGIFPHDLPLSGHIIVDATTSVQPPTCQGFPGRTEGVT